MLQFSKIDSLGSSWSLGELVKRNIQTKERDTMLMGVNLAGAKFGSFPTTKRARLLSEQRVNADKVVVPLGTDGTDVKRCFGPDLPQFGEDRGCRGGRSGRARDPRPARLRPR